jgi:hypothetical protein
MAVLSAVCLCAMALPRPSLSANAPGDIAWVRMPSADYNRTTSPAVHVLDYGSFAWLEAEGVNLAYLQVSRLSYQVYPDPFML